MSMVLIISSSSSSSLSPVGIKSPGPTFVIMSPAPSNLVLLVVVSVGN